MVMRPEPWGEALDEILPSDEEAPVRLVVPSPAGALFTQAMARELAGEEHLIFACGRYEGIDERVLDHARTRVAVSEISIGDYVLFGGEVAALVILEAVIRLRPGVLGNADSLVEESHVDGLLEAPLYTKPAVWRGMAVPEVLRSGDHARIARWRREQAQRRTAERRPDLLAAPNVVGRVAPESGAW
jgi:tRNA (guanine37-N1)-methyltransferase